MNNTSKAIAALGLGLVAVNTATGGYWRDIKAAITGDKMTHDAHVAFLAVIGQVLFVLILAFLADSSPDFGTVLVALIIGLWLVWAVSHADSISGAAKFLGINANASATATSTSSFNPIKGRSSGTQAL